MAHEITVREDGIAEAAFAIVKPWHGLGIVTDDLMTPEEALKLANMDWTVSMSPIQTIEEFGGVRVEGYRAVIRDDSMKPLGIVKRNYTPVQNAQQIDIIKSLIGEGLSVSAVGSLFGGKRTFWTCKCPQNMVLSDGDQIERYLILSNGHDGLTPFHIFWSPIRVVCNNTLSASLRQATDKFCIRHTAQVESRIEEARKILGLAESYYENLGDSFETMKKKPMTVDQFIKDMLYPTFDVKEEEKSTRMSNKLESITENFESAPGAEQTVFGGYNAITYYTSHQQIKRTKTRDNVDERRFESVTSGAGKDLSDKAFNIALSLVG